MTIYWNYIRFFKLVCPIIKKCICHLRYIRDNFYFYWISSFILFNYCLCIFYFVEYDRSKRSCQIPGITCLRLISSYDLICDFRFFKNKYISFLSFFSSRNKPDLCNSRFYLHLFWWIIESGKCIGRGQ